MRLFGTKYASAEFAQGVSRASGSSLFSPFFQDNTRTTQFGPAAQAKPEYSSSGRTPASTRWYLQSNPLLDLFDRFQLNPRDFLLEPE